MIALLLALSNSWGGDGYFVNRDHNMVQLWWTRTGQEMSLGPGDITTMELLSDGKAMGALVWHLSSGDIIVSHELSCAKVDASIRDAWLMLHSMATPVEVKVAEGACSVTVDSITSDRLPPADAWLPEGSLLNLAWADPVRLRVLRKEEVRAIEVRPQPEDAAEIRFTLWDDRVYTTVDADCEGRAPRIAAAEKALAVEATTEPGVCGFEPPWTLAVAGIKNLTAADRDALQAVLEGAIETCDIQSSGAATLKARRKGNGDVSMVFKDILGEVPSPCLQTALMPAVNGKYIARIAWQKNR